MVASGFGIAAQLPYLKRLLHGYNSRRIRTRRIHLVWKLKSPDLPLAIERLLNNALDDDTLDDGYILQISVYVEHVKRDDKISPRANVIKGLPHWGTILRDEVAGKYIKRVQEEAKVREDMIVTVSASLEVRTDLRSVVRGYIAEKVELVELDYQPCQ
ncbi:hypothetical protein JDV02_001888 [Purpureocillium takamizusanense]|uniref:Ferric reductase NAD binding domain-containing protein n=1 Tax=Purpureocillium takamizusanense TaxID=2060973 RepID=A0A9Q8V753_9HYPO|nr:uncharacterized protein JDV02_001888 [Purpureocillium takamizusanense]UNI15348.1 hypothetical protein JDV02_001888 [Purpureocillium takamizusanense]